MLDRGKRVVIDAPLQAAPAAAPTVPSRRRSIVGRLLLWVGSLSVLLLVVIVAAASVGPASAPIGATVATIARRAGVPYGEVTPAQQRIIEQIRLPRIVTALLVGAALATAGAALQAVFRNPLADPGVIGVSGGAALGAVSGIALRFATAAAPGWALPLTAFVGSLLAVGGVMAVATAGGRLAPATLILAGLAVQALTGALTSAVITMTGDPELVRNMLFWLVGGFDGRSWAHVNAILPAIAGGVFALALLGRDLNVLAQGDEAAHGLGLAVGATRLLVLGIAAVITATAVSVSGTIGFVGLIVPHAFRLLVGGDYRLLLPVSAVGGAAFLITADTVARTALQPAELRTGVVTALLGAPFFIFLLWRNRARIGDW
ncbi:MAG: iron ABC transporter permease [Chloroflexota bacterium]|nr:iron ABC transporter permease [Dehalococcoidia bacterium]MDW8255029.1 iron ABC transporter permease [Chloroflexota bacterium]